jgi:hypothetical protein
MRHFGWLTAVALALLPACRAGAIVPPGAVREESLASRLDRGTWEVRRATEVWKVGEAVPDRPPRHIGYLVARDYRQHVGGPVFRMYEVTSLNRNEILGRIDQMGHATRYEPRRRGGFEEVDAGTNSLPNSVGAIFQTPKTITLEKTTERRLAFEAIDANKDGLLQAEEYRAHGASLFAADTNGDKIVDFAEFDAIDAL